MPVSSRSSLRAASNSVSFSRSCLPPGIEVVRRSSRLPFTKQHYCIVFHGDDLNCVRAFQHLEDLVRTVEGPLRPLVRTVDHALEGEPRPRRERRPRTEEERSSFSVPCVSGCRVDAGTPARGVKRGEKLDLEFGNDGDYCLVLPPVRTRVRSGRRTPSR